MHCENNFCLYSLYSLEFITGIAPPIIFLIIAYKATQRKNTLLNIDNDDEEEELTYNPKIIGKILNSVILAIVAVKFYCKPMIK